MSDLAGFMSGEVPEQSVGARRVRYGRGLRRAREGAGLTQVEVAAAVGVDQARVSKAERGVESSEETLVLLERLYGRPDSYPSAPKDPVRRIEWFEGRNAGIQARGSRDAAVTEGRRR